MLSVSVYVKFNKAMMIYSLKGQEMGDWKRKEVDSTNLPFYLNNRTGEISWDHPEFMSVMKATKNFEDFRYCTYRTAFKIRSIQKVLKWDLITLHKVKSALKESKFGLDDSPTVMSPEVQRCLTLLYGNAKNDIGFAENPVTLADLMLNFLLNVFLPKRDKAVFSALQIKIVLILMCSGGFMEKYKCIYQHVSAASGGVCRENLELLFDALHKIPALCGESLRFGSHFVQLAVESLLHFTENDITEANFMIWTKNEPQNLAWMPALYRISISETVVHGAHCAVCQSNPIVGLRFKCMHCLGYSLCQRCFLCGLSNWTHDTDHPTKEYACQATCWDEGKTALTILKHRLFSKRKSRNICNNESTPHFLERACTMSNKKVAVCNDSVQKELNDIIARLESSSRKLVSGLNSVQGSPIVPCDCANDCLSSQMLVSFNKFLQEHYQLMNLQLHRLRLLMKDLYVSEGNNKDVNREGKQNEAQDSCSPVLNTCSKVEGDEAVTLSMKGLQYTISDLTAGYSSCDSAMANFSTTSLPSGRKSNSDGTQDDSWVAASFENICCALDISTTGDTSSNKSKYEYGFAVGPNSTIKVTNSEVLNIVKDIDGLFSLSEGLPDGSVLQEKDKFLKTLQELREKLAVVCSTHIANDSAQSTNL